MFTPIAGRVQANMAKTSAQAQVFASRIEAAQARITTGLTVLGVGAAAMFALSFPTREAMAFEKATTRVHTIAERAGYSLKEIQRIARELSMDFVQTPTEEAEALYSTIAAGIEDVGRAQALLRSANVAAVGTESDLDKVITGLAAFVNAYGLGDFSGVDMLTERERRTLSAQRAQELNRQRQVEASEREFTRLNDMIFEAMNVGLFSHSPGVSDFEAMVSQFGKFAPIGSAVGLSEAELLALWATATRGGQDAMRSATGLRQMFMDFLKPTSRMYNFTQWATQQGANLHVDPSTGMPNFPRMIRGEGILNVMGLIRDFVTEDAAGLASALQSESIVKKLEDLGKLPENVNLQDSDQAMQLLRELQNLGVIDVNKAVQVFKSVWGLTAAIPLLTTQFDELGNIIQRVEGATGGMQQAFEMMMDTASEKTALFTSRWQTLLTIIGTGGLPIYSGVLDVLNALIRGIIEVADRFPFLTQVVMTSLMAISALTVVIGLLIATSGGLRWANAKFQQFFMQLRWGARWAAGGIKTAFFDIFFFVALLAAGVMAFRWAWENNFMGMTETLTRWWRRVQLVGSALLEWVRTLSEDGIGSIPESLAQQLEAEGLFDTFTKLAMITYRLITFVDGFVAGVKAALEATRDVFLYIIDHIVRPLLAIIDAGLGTKLSGFLDRIIVTPTQENVDSWRSYGRVIGGVVTMLAVFGLIVRPIIRVVGFLGRVLGVVLRIGRGVVALGRQIAVFFAPILRRLLPVLGRFRVLGWLGRIIAGAFRLAIGPIGWVLLAADTFYFLWKNNIFGIRDILKNFWEGVKSGFRNVMTFIRNIWDNIVGWIDHKVNSIANRIIGVLNLIPGVNITPLGGVPEAPIAYEASLSKMGTTDTDFAALANLTNQVRNNPDDVVAQYMQILLDRAVSGDSDSKATITKAEFQAIMAEFSRLVSENSDKTVLVTIDGYEVARAVENQAGRGSRTSPAGAY